MPGRASRSSPLATMSRSARGSSWLVGGAAVGAHAEGVGAGDFEEVGHFWNVSAMSALVVGMGWVRGLGRRGCVGKSGIGSKQLATGR